jgi:flagellar biosynthesis/type III secretory pathway protein FliH
MALSADEQARMLADSREKLRRDISAQVHEAEARGREEGWEGGLEEGLEKGREEGLEKGLEKGLMTVARNLLKLGRPLEEIQAATGLGAKVIQSLMH